MRFARVYGFCIVLILHRVSHVYSSSPPTQGAGIFGSPTAAPLNESPFLASNLIRGPPVVNNSPAGMFPPPHGAWQSSPGNYSTTGIKGVHPRSHISYPLEGKDYAAGIFASPAQPAATSKLAISERDVVPQVPAVDPVAAAGQPTAVRPPSAAAAAALSFPSPQPLTAMDTNSLLTLASSRDELPPSRPGDIPQLKKSTPWLFSATREKLLGAIHFMKYAEEQGSYLHGYHTEARTAGSPNSGRTNPGRYHYHVGNGGLLGTNTAAGNGTSEAGTVADDYSRPNLTQPQSYTLRNVGPRVAPFDNPRGKGKSMEHNATSAYPTDAHSAEPAHSTREAVYNHYLINVPQPLLRHELLQLHQKQPLQLLPTQQQLQQLQLQQLQLQQLQLQLQQQQQRLQQHPQEVNPEQSETPSPLHVPVEGERPRDRQHEKTTDPIQQTHEQPQAKQQAESPQHKQQHPQSLSEERQPHPTQQETAVFVARPFCDVPLFPQIPSMQTESISPAIGHHTRYNVYVSEDGEYPEGDVRLAAGALLDTAASPQIAQVGTAATSAFSFEEKDLFQSHQGTKTGTQQVPQPLEVAATRRDFSHGSFTTQESRLAPEADHTKLREAMGLNEGNMGAKVHLPANPAKVSDGKVPITHDVVKVKKFLAPEAYTVEEQEELERPGTHLAPQTVQNETGGDKTVFSEGHTGANVHYRAKTNPGKRSNPRASITDATVNAGDFLAAEARRTENQDASGEGSNLIKGELLHRKDQATTPYVNASFLTSTGSTFAEENNSPTMVIVETTENYARFQEELDTSREGRAASDANVAELSLLPADDAAVHDASEEPGDAPVKRCRENAYTATDGSTTGTAAAQGKLGQRIAALQGETEERGRAGADSRFEVSHPPVLQVNTEVEERSEIAPFDTATGTRFGIQRASAEGDATPLSFRGEFFSPGGAPRAIVVITASSQKPGLKKQDSDASSAVSTETESPRSASQLMQRTPPHIVSRSTIPIGATTGVPQHGSPLAPPLQPLQNGSENAVSASIPLPVLVRHPPQSVESPPIAPAAPHKPPVVLPASSPLQMQVNHAQTDTVPTFREAPNVNPHANMRLAAPAEVVHRDPAYVIPSRSFTGASALTSSEVGMTKRPLSMPGEFLTSDATTEVLQPLPLNTKNTLPGGSTFPAAQAEEVPTPFPFRTPYIAQQRMCTPFPASCIHLLPAAQPVYVSPSKKTDVKSTSPAPVYIGQSIRQEMTGGPPPVYPLGARLYQRMIPRAELILASSTYAEEYLDLIAALYCLFHKWPCNNMQEFAEETRKRQNEMNFSEAAAKTVA